MKVEKKVLKPEPPPAEFIITLNEQEAKDLWNVFGSLCEDPPERKTTAALWRGLDELGANPGCYISNLQNMRLIRRK